MLSRGPDHTEMRCKSRVSSDMSRCDWPLPEKRRGSLRKSTIGGKCGAGKWSPDEWHHQSSLMYFESDLKTLCPCCITMPHLLQRTMGITLPTELPMLTMDKAMLDLIKKSLPWERTCLDYNGSNRAHSFYVTLRLTAGCFNRQSVWKPTCTTLDSYMEG